MKWLLELHQTLFPHPNTKGSQGMTTRVYGVEPHSYIDLFHGLQCNVHGSHDY